MNNNDHKTEKRMSETEETSFTPNGATGRGYSSDEYDEGALNKATPVPPAKKLWCFGSNGPEGKDEEVAKIGLFTLFRFADRLDVLLMLAGSVFMLALGAAVIVNIYYFGHLTTDFVQLETQRSNGTAQKSNCQDNSQRNNSITADHVLTEVETVYVPAFLSLGVITFILAYLGITFWTWSGARQIRRIRNGYFESLMKQSVGWFDLHNTGELNSCMVENINRLHDGFGQKMALIVGWMSTFVSGYLLGFIISWKLTLVVLALCPLIAIVMGILSLILRRLAHGELIAFAKAGSVAEETFSSIRTVAAFGGENMVSQKYSSHVQDAYMLGVKKWIVEGTGRGFFWLAFFSITGLAFWFGAMLISDECLPAGAIFQVFVGVLIGSLALGSAAPAFLSVANARAAATILFKAIDMPVVIDTFSVDGLEPATLEGNIKFQNVGFSYPSRPTVKVLNDFNLTVRKGQTVALVGESGCGKSTTTQLIQRFYECDEGKILVDGEDLRDYNLTWLRNYMGIVSQDPVLFATTIGENIRLGSKWGDEITQEQIETAAKQANCYDFITELPEGFDTLVGERGIQLSGGQKQRIAIARALVRNPAILLLDEGTSALDTQSEAIVQDALDKASQGRTTLVIAQKLSTIKSADKIFIIREGRVIEDGTHDQLMTKKGKYFTMVREELRQQKEKPKRAPSDKSALIDEKDQYLQCKSDTSMIGSTELILDTEYSGENINEGGKLKKATPNMTYADILAMNKPEWRIIAFGVFWSVISGCTPPVNAFILSEIVKEYAKHEREVSFLAGCMVLLGVLTCTSYFLQNLAFGVSGERLTRKLRQMCFKTVLHQDISYFDDEEHAVGGLLSRLSTEAPLVKGATGVRIGLVIQISTTVVGIFLTAFLLVWELGLALLVFMPIAFLIERARYKTFAGETKIESVGVKEGAEMSYEAISNMRTVTSLNRQIYFTTKFYRHFKQLYKNDLKKSLVYGLSYAGSHCMQYSMYALCFGLGGYFIVCDQCLPWRSEPLPFFHLLRIYLSIALGGISIAECLSQLPDQLKAKLAASSVRDLLRIKSRIDSSSTCGDEPRTCRGKVRFTNVQFSYPTRPLAPVLQGISFMVEKGETLALVGASGCGKSTNISLLERFYDCNTGIVAIDGNDIKSLNIQWLRHNLGLVSQEPTLFDASIAENIAYGDNTREVSMAEIIQVATKANAHNFITSLPNGYDTSVGAKGAQLSGGQRQRIAIARVLIRNPAILLLDEATSALDPENAKVVQEALDEAVVGRTAIIIAHRLSTIKNANKIGVIKEGEIVEFGTHEQLLEKKGAYFDLFNAQL